MGVAAYHAGSIGIHGLEIESAMAGSVIRIDLDIVVRTQPVALRHT